MRACVRFFMVLLAFSTLCLQPAEACSCAELGPAKCPNLKELDRIFVGKVLDIENPPDERPGADQRGVSRYLFQVLENINGANEAKLDVYSGRGGADCSYHFRLGETYIVFPSTVEGKLFATICTDTRPLTNGDPLLSELRARRDGKAFASIFGVLWRTQQPYELTLYDDFDKPLAGVMVELRADDRIFTTQTDQHGVYRFYGTPAGIYRFVAVLPANLVLAQTILREPLPPVAIPDNACYEHALEALPTGRIRGRVLGADGAPIKYADVELFRSDRYTDEARGWWEFQDKDDGYFEFYHVAPGTYIIVFHNSNNADPDIPYRRTFYPGSPDLKSALTVTVADGQEFLNADIHAIGYMPTRQLIVRVHWTESPVPEDVYVFAKSSEGGMPIAERIAPGVYQFTLFHGVRYTIYASQDCGRRWEGNTSFPIGIRETEQVTVDGSDSRTPEVSLSLIDKTCRPYRIPTKPLPLR